MKVTHLERFIMAAMITAHCKRDFVLNEVLDARIVCVCSSTSSSAKRTWLEFFFWLGDGRLRWARFSHITLCDRNCLYLANLADSCSPNSRF